MVLPILWEVTRKITPAHMQKEPKGELRRDEAKLMSAEPKPIMACRKKRFTNWEDAITYGARRQPMYRWKSYFCHVCLAWHMSRKRNHQGKGKKGTIQIIKVVPRNTN